MIPGSNKVNLIKEIDQLNNIQGLVGGVFSGFNFNNNQKAINFNNILNCDRCQLQSPPETSFHITSKTGSGADIIPIVNNGKLIGGFINSPGERYNEYRDVITAIDSGRGTGASVKFTTDSNGGINQIKIILPGNGYSGVPPGVSNQSTLTNRIPSKASETPKKTDNINNEIIVPIIKNIDIVNVGVNYGNPVTDIPDLRNEFNSPTTTFTIEGRIVGININYPFVGYFGRYVKIKDLDNTGYGAKARINYEFLLLKELQPSLNQPIIYSKNCPI